MTQEARYISTSSVYYPAIVAVRDAAERGVSIEVLEHILAEFGAMRVTKMDPSKLDEFIKRVNAL